MSAWGVQGMGRGKVPADWPPITQGEAAAVLGHFPDVDALRAVRWRSRRPLSAAALVVAGDRVLFVKRHHRSVRDVARLGEEHAFAAHLRRCGVPLPLVLATRSGGSVVVEGEWVYEVQEEAAGLDAYRDVLSWEPYRSAGHARAAGAALGRFHQAAASYGAPARRPGILGSSDEVVRALDPQRALSRQVGARPGLARALSGWPWRSQLAEIVVPRLAAAAPRVARLEPQWGHGDWHPSNLRWAAADRPDPVVGVIDLGLANRTSAVHDLAVALERAVVGWLDLEETGEAPVDLEGAEALVAGYCSVRALGRGEVAALVALLPVVHVDFALSEIEYFASVVGSATNTELAYRGYLLGHAAWFAGAPAAGRLLACVEKVAASPVG